MYDYYNLKELAMLSVWGISGQNFSLEFFPTIFQAEMSGLILLGQNLKPKFQPKFSGQKFVLELEIVSLI